MIEDDNIKIACLCKEFIILVVFNVHTWHTLFSVIC